MKNRLEAIKEIFLAEKKVDVTDLSSRLNVSEVSIRKYLTTLESQGFLVRRYGGAVLAENPQYVTDYLRKIDVCSAEKRKIAKRAASMIQDDENILLDAGSTTLALARELKNRRLRVVTNSLAVANELCDSNEVVLEMIGGSLRKASGAMIGPRTCKALEDIRVDNVFVGCSGFDPELGFSSENAVEAETKHKMLSCGKIRTILADHTKFERPAFANFAACDDIDRVIVDQITPEISILEKRNIKIIE